MKTPLILKCDSCNTPLNEFETNRWNNLLVYWGGKAGSRKPKCGNCYRKYIQQAREKATL